MPFSPSPWRSWQRDRFRGPAIGSAVALNATRFHGPCEGQGPGSPVRRYANGEE